MTPSRLAGVLFLVTHVTSVAAVVLYGGSASDPNAPLADRTSVLIGGLLEVVLALAILGTAVTLYPLIRSRAPMGAPAYVALRTLEAGVVLAWVLLQGRFTPRFIPVLGLIGGPLIGLANVAVMFGLTTAQPLAAVPVFAWEIALAGYLLVRGLRVAPGTVGATTRDAVPAGHR